MKKNCGQKYDWECWMFKTKHLREWETATLELSYIDIMALLFTVPYLTRYCIPPGTKISGFYISEIRERKKSTCTFSDCHTRTTWRFDKVNKKTVIWASKAAFRPNSFIIYFLENKSILDIQMKYAVIYPKSEFTKCENRRGIDFWGVVTYLFVVKLMGKEVS